MHSAPSNFFVQRFQNLDSKDLGLWDLGMNNGCSVCPRGDPWGTPLQVETRHPWARSRLPRGQIPRSPRPKVPSVLTVGRLGYGFLWVFARISPELHRNFTRVHRNFARISNRSTLNRGDSRNSDLPHFRACPTFCM